MPIVKFIGIGTARKEDFFDYVLSLLELEQPSIIALDENPIAFSTLIQMRRSPELFNEEFILNQTRFLLKRGLEVGNSAGVLYALRRPGTPVYFADGSFMEPLSDTGEEVGIYPYFTDVEFAASTDLMTTPVELLKERIPVYPGHDFDYELIHAYQTDAKNEQMDRAIWQRNQFTARVVNQIMRNHDAGVLAFIGDRKRFRLDLYEKTPGIGEAELKEYKPLTELILADTKVVYDAVEQTRTAT
jgi:hypothetical protein